MGEPCPAPLRVAMRSPLPFPCVPDRPYKILLAQVGTLSFSHPLFGVSVLFLNTQVTDKDAFKSLKIYLTRFKLKELELTYLFNKTLIV